MDKYKEIESFVIRKLLPIAVKSTKTGKLVYPYRSKEAHEHIIKCVTNGLVEKLNLGSVSGVTITDLNNSDRKDRVIYLDGDIIG